MKDVNDFLLRHLKWTAGEIGKGIYMGESPSKAAGSEKFEESECRLGLIVNRDECKGEDTIEQAVSELRGFVIFITPAETDALSYSQANSTISFPLNDLREDTTALRTIEVGLKQILCRMALDEELRRGEGERSNA